MHFWLVIEDILYYGPFSCMLCIVCDTWTPLFTGKSNKDKENVQLTGFDIVRQRHSSNSDNNTFTQPQGVLSNSLYLYVCTIIDSKK